jgi:regulator of replication initiation timing
MSDQDALVFQTESEHYQEKLASCEADLAKACKRVSELFAENKKLREENEKLLMAWGLAKS